MESKIPKTNLYIVLISPHGLIRASDLELGRDSDTGGQITYVVELAKALIEHRDVEKVDLITRMVSDSKINSDYARAREEIVPGVQIVRIPFGPRRYLRKERLWPYLDNMADNIFRYFRAVGRAPDIIHAHYADAGFVGSRLAGVLGIPLVYTGHSLGRVKKQSLMDQGLKLPAIENRYHIGRRVEAEEMALDNASLVVASTKQEVEEQYGIYDNYQPRRMIVIPPGVDLSRFKPPKRLWSEYPSIGAEINKFLRDPKKPMILAISRPDPRKNIATLIKAYAGNENLKEKANLVIVLGSREDIRKMDKSSRDVMSEVVMLIDYYDLYGKVAIPKHHTSEDVPDLYRLAAKSGGMFVNSALTEPFGLTLIEAAASGLPIVAPKDGGPKDIVAACKNGLFIDPLDPAKIGQTLLESIDDRERWKKWARSGVNGANRHYSWTNHVAKYVRSVKKVMAQYGRRVWPRSNSRLITTDRFLICDIDNTLVGDQEGIVALLEKVHQAGDRLGFGVATGRSLALTLKALKQWKIPPPNVLITDVGSKIYYGPNLQEDHGWRMHINYRWRPDEIKNTLAGALGIKSQPEEGQSSHKISYFVNPKKPPKIREFTRSLRRAGLPVNMIYSHQSYLDVLPIRASKGTAVRYFADKWGIPFERILVVGDSGNDEEMLSGNMLGAVVGNYSQELNKLRGRANIYFAEGKYAWGILEALEYYSFIGDLKK